MINPRSAQLGTSNVGSAGNLGQQPRQQGDSATRMTLRRFSSAKKLGGFIASAADSSAPRKFGKWNSAVWVAALMPNLEAGIPRQEKGMHSPAPLF